MTRTASIVRQLDPAALQCPVTGLPLVRLPAFTDVEISPSYFVSLTRIGDSVLHSQARGNLRTFDYQRFMALADAFGDASGMRKPVVHIYDLFDVTGRMSFGGIKGITRYYVDHQHEIMGLVMLQQPSWVQPFIDHGYRLFQSSFRVVPVQSYDDAIIEALAILRKSPGYPTVVSSVSLNRSGTEKTVDQITDLFGGVQVEEKPSSIRVSAQDLEEISNAFGLLQWIEGEDYPEAQVSPSNPLAYLVESLELVKRDIVEMRKQEQRAQEERLSESEVARRRLLSMMEDAEAARAALLREQEARRILLDHIPIQIWYLTDEITYGAVNRAHADFVGVAIEDLAFHHLRDVLPEEMAKVALLSNREVFSTGQPVCVEEWVPRASGERRLISVYKLPRIRGDGAVEYVVCSAEDITERKQTEVEREKLQAQLTQAQKMESVGRLAGGVAHDFNNMLAVILGNAEMAMAQLSPENPLHADLEDIREAATRSANLTRQLLAFARKQTISPRVMHLNDAIEQMLKILRRLIGENIELVFRPRTDLWSVKVDPGQVDQILANLCVNARDAIAGVGRITIGTHHTIFDDAYCADHLGAVLGEYVQISVSDDGCGMDKEIQSHLFEPFYTTKPQGEGTGLGLATVYGTVKQNEGYISVYSEPVQGTTFRIYLPRYVGETAAASEQIDAVVPERGSETVLVVEDDAAILKMTARILQRLGYNVLTARSPQEALRLVEEHCDEIDLLLTDVIMPGMNGRDLFFAIQSQCPKIRCLFMSGYTADVIARHGVLEKGIQFIQKPFSLEELAEALRKIVDAEEHKQ